jgi:hypothetical protein
MNLVNNLMLACLQFLMCMHIKFIIIMQVMLFLGQFRNEHNKFLNVLFNYACFLLVAMRVTYDNKESR